MPVFWRRKPCSAGKTGCGKKGSKPSFRYRCIRKKNGIADIIRLRFLAGHCQKKWKRILIVDDIYTTGSTVEAVAERLKEAGAEQVYVLTACIGRGF